MKPIPHSKSDDITLGKVGVPLYSPHTYHLAPVSVIHLKRPVNTCKTFNPIFRVKVPFTKRLFDIVVSGIALLVLFPVFVVVSILIKLDSKGPVFYKSKRVGTGYKTFNLYKFSTRRARANQQFKKLASQHLYYPGKAQQALPEPCEECRQPDRLLETILHKGEEVVYERMQQPSKKEKEFFMKFGSKPRITPLGRFLRNTHLDALPQLVNILKGDISFIGNQPLPLHLAEKFIADGFIIRFAAPAGLTGLSQIAKRRKKYMSASERLQLDIEYAENYSFWFDMKILFKALTAS